MPFVVTKDPKTGEETVVYQGKPEPPQGVNPLQQITGAIGGAQRAFQQGVGTVMSTTPMGLVGGNLQMGASALGAGIQEYAKTGDLGKAGVKAQQTYNKELQQLTPAATVTRVATRAGRNVAQELSDVVTADLPAALGVPGAKPTTAQRPDAPFLGVAPPLPKLKSSGPGEDLAVGLVQAAIEWLPAFKAVGLAGKGLKAIPGATRVVQGTEAAAQALKGTKAVQAAARVPGLAPVTKAVVENVASKNAAAGALVDVVGFDQHEGRLYDLADKLYQQSVGTPLELPLLSYLKSNPNDVGMAGRFKNAVEGAGLGTVVESIYRIARAAKYTRLAEQATAEQAPRAQEQAQQAVKDLEDHMAQEVQKTQEAAAPVAAAAQLPAPGTFAAAVTPEVLPAEAGAGSQRRLSTEFREKLQNLGGSLADVTRTMEGVMQRQEESLARRATALEQEMAAMGMPPTAQPVAQALPPAAAEPTAKVKFTATQRAEIENFNTTLMQEMGIDLNAPLSRTQLETLESSIRRDFAPPDEGGVETVTAATRRSMIKLADKLRKTIDGMEPAPAVAVPAAQLERPLVKPGIGLSHGTTEAGKKGILTEGFRVSQYEKSGTVAGEGVYMTPSGRYAKEYGQKTVEGALPEDAKILDWTGSGQTLASLADEIGIPGPRDVNKSAGEVELNQVQQQQLKQWALDNGYDGIQYRTNFTPGGKATEVVIYNVDLANRLVGSQAAPAAPVAAAAVPTPERIAQIDEALAMGRADLSPEERIALRDQLLAQEAGGGAGAPPPPPEPPTSVAVPPPDDNWANRLVDQVERYREGLDAGEITINDLIDNNVQKIQSPSGRTSYVAVQPEMVVAYRAFSDAFTRAAATGIQSFTDESIRFWTKDYLKGNGFNDNALEAIAPLSGALADTERNLRALHLAAVYTDYTNKQAGIAATKWLNGKLDEGSNMTQLTAELLTAAAAQKRANVALESVTRPIGQLLRATQIPRDLTEDIAKGATPSPVPAGKDIASEFEEALVKEQDTPLADSIGMPISEETRNAILTGEYSPQSLAELDALAKNIAQGGVTPGFARGFWDNFNKSAMLGVRGLVMYRAAQLLSSGLTFWSNNVNNTIRLLQLPLTQALGATAQLQFSRASQSMRMYGQYSYNLQNAFRLATESFKLGRGLYDLDDTAVDFLDRLASQDSASNLAKQGADGMPEWSLNTLPWVDVQDRSTWAIVQKRLWQALNLSTRFQVASDTFYKTLAGSSFEYVRNLQPGLDHAAQLGIQPGSPQAWKFAEDYARAAVDKATRDLTVDGRTILDAVMESPSAQTAMRYTTFTDDIWAQMESRTTTHGMKLGRAKGLEGEELAQFAQDYAISGSESTPFFSRTFSTMPMAWQKLLDWSPLFSVIQPFNKTPGDLVKAAARQSPLAPLVDTWWRDINSEDPFTRDRAIGDVAVGSGAVALAMLALNSGAVELTGGGPVDPDAKRKWRDEGKQPYSIRFAGGDWISMRAFEPLTTLFGVIGDYHEIANKVPVEARERMAGSIVIDILTQVAAGQLSKTYYQGFMELFEAAQGIGEMDAGPNKRNAAARYIERIVASMVPYSSALRAGRRLDDPTVRDIPPSNAGFPMNLAEETFAEIKNLIPGWSQTLPPRINYITGQPMVLSGVFGDQFLPADQPWLATLFQYLPTSAFQLNRRQQDPVMLEMAKLSGKGASFDSPRNTEFGKQLRLDPYQMKDLNMAIATTKDEFGRTLHQALLEEIQSERYQALPQDQVSTLVMGDRAASLNIIVGKFKLLGKEAFLAKYPGIRESLDNVEGRNQDVQFRLRYRQAIDVNTFVEALR